MHIGKVSRQRAYRAYRLTVSMQPIRNDSQYQVHHAQGYRDGDGEKDNGRPQIWLPFTLSAL